MKEKKRLSSRDLVEDDAIAATAIAASEETASASNAEARLGSELRRLRKMKLMSLDELADVSGVSRAMISKIELGQSSPSTSVLSKLVDALDTTVARLMGHEAQTNDVVVLRHDQQAVLVDPSTGFSRRCLSPIFPGRGLDFIMAEIPAKADTGPLAAHSTPVEEYIYVIAGELIVTVGETRTTLSPTDAIYYRADAPHRFENPGRTTCRYLIIINPVRP